MSEREHLNASGNGQDKRKKSLEKKEMSACALLTKISAAKVDLVISSQLHHLVHRNIQRRTAKDSIETSRSPSVNAGKQTPGRAAYGSSRTEALRKT